MLILEFRTLDTDSIYFTLTSCKSISTEVKGNLRISTLSSIENLYILENDSGRRLLLIPTFIGAKPRETITGDFKGDFVNSFISISNYLSEFVLPSVLTKINIFLNKYHNEYSGRC